MTEPLPAVTRGSRPQIFDDPATLHEHSKEIARRLIGVHGLKRTKASTALRRSRLHKKHGVAEGLDTLAEGKNDDLRK